MCACLLKKANEKRVRDCVVEIIENNKVLLYSDGEQALVRRSGLVIIGIVHQYIDHHPKRASSKLGHCPEHGSNRLS